LGLVKDKAPNEKTHDAKSTRVTVVSKWEREANELVVKLSEEGSHHIKHIIPNLSERAKRISHICPSVKSFLESIQRFLSLQLLLACMLLSTGQWQKQQMNS